MEQALGAVDFFAEHPVWKIQIELTPESANRLRAESRSYVRANVTVFGEMIRDAGIHLKGTGSFRPLDDKPSFTIDFSKFDREQRLQGLQKIHLNNSVQDVSYVKEQIASELFRAAHVPVPRVAHAVVELNGRSLGLYVVKEGFTEEFLNRHFERADGNLYDTDEGHDIDRHMKRHLGRDPNDGQTELKRLADATAENDFEKRWTRLGETLDLDRFMTFMAMEIMICHWDGYCLGQNNFRIYHDPASDKILFLPSGLDQVFSKADLTWKPETSGIVSRAILELPAGQRRYAEKFRYLLDRVLVSATLTNRVNQLVEQIRPFVKGRELSEMLEEAREFSGRIAQREQSLKKQVNEPEPAPAVFVGEVAAVSGWKIFDESPGGRMHDGPNAEGKPVLQIVAGSSTSASWRTIVRLPRGRYEFRGNARVSNTTPLAFGKNQGASLRVAGKGRRSSELMGTTGWQTLKTDFEVAGLAEDVVLICELRATTGEVEFDKTSLNLVRQR